MKSMLGQSLAVKNAELEKELAQKVHELQIEAALERVRSVAMGMRTPDDLLSICMALFAELQLLDFSDLRNAIIHTYLNVNYLIDYDYSDFTQGHISHIPYRDNPIAEKYARDIRKTKDAFAELIITGSKLKEWKVFMDANNEAPDERLSNATSLYYYIYAVGDASIGISTFSPIQADKLNVLKRFRNVFDLAYRRFVDINKAEAQAREAQIQLALERVRARAMAMQKSEELHEVIQLVFDQLQQLNFKIDNANFTLNYQETDDLDLWLAVAGAQYPTKIYVPYFKHPMFDRFNKAKGKGGLFTDTLSKEEKDSFFGHFFKYVPKVLSERKALAFSHPGFARSVVFMKNTVLTIINYQGIPFSEAENNTLLRFGQVFDQTYTRFNDLKQAEEQARESRIQLALERVRARTMAMQHSSELQEASLLLFQQAESLGVKAFACGFNVWDDNWKFATGWMGSVQGFEPPFKTDSSKDVYLPIYKAAKKGEPLFVIEQGGKELEAHYGYLATIPTFRDVILKGWTDAGLSAPTFQIIHCAYFAQGYLMFISYESCPEAYDIFKRFAKVFEQTYTRFLDLQKAEEQAREGQIQLGLERVRARAMAMQSSDELAELVDIVFKELTRLDFGLTHCAIAIADADSVGLTLWQANSEADQPPISFYRKSFDHPYPNAAYKEWKKRTPKWVYHLEGAEKRAMHDYYERSQETMYVPNAVKAGMAAFDSIILSHSFNNFGYLRTDTVTPLSEENLEIVYRFAKVFDLCYTRFNDIKQAEAQARESQIQLGLERVRAKAMAMRSSEELNELIGSVFSELTKLDFVLTRCLIMIFDPETKASRWWMANSEAPAGPMNYLVQFHKNPAYDAYLKAWKERDLKWNYALKGKVKRDWDDFLFIDTELAQLPGPVIEGMKAPEQVLLSASFNNFGCLTLVTLEPLSDEHSDIMLRFAKVFDMCYTRFNDLKQAEEQARESQIQLALERVRAKTMAMQKSEELAIVIQAIYDQLVHIGLDIVSAGFVMDYKKSADLNLWVANQGEPNAYMVNIPYYDGLIFSLFNEAKEKGLDFYPVVLNKEEKDIHYKHVFQHTRPVPGEVKEWVYSMPGYADSHVLMKDVVLFISNLTGIPYSDEENTILMRFGKVFEQTYTRFSDLKKAEEQARESQIQLALERVRARSIAMQKSEELHEVIQLILDQLHQLNFGIDVANFALNYQETNDLDLWIAVAGAQYAMKICVPYFSNPVFDRFNIAKKKGGLFSDTLSKDEKNSFFEHFFKYTPEVAKERKSLVFEAPGFARSAIFMKNTVLTIINYQGIPYSEAENNTLLRFGQAFDQIYTRFNDLKQAEAQARESQIQLALERVRARTMAMQKSDELAETATILFQQLLNMGISSERTFIGIPNDDTRKFELWGTEQGGHQMSTRFEYEADATYAFSEIYKAWQEKRSELTVILKGKHIEEHVNYVRNVLHMPLLAELVQKQRILYNAFFSKGLLMIVTPEVQSEETLNILKRFAAVFDQTYTRFLDLEKAEAQAREGQIQLGLERVRAAAMAMHDSNDVGNATALVFSELYKLGITTSRCGVCIIDGAAQQMEVWSANSSSDGKVNRGAGKLDMKGHPLWLYLLEAWRKKIPSFSYELKGKELKDYYKAIKNAPDYEAPQDIQVGQTLDNNQYCNCYIFNEGCLFTFTQAPFLPETSQVLEKFAAVFGLTYRRYLDLTKAEAQAREAQIEASLEKVRSKAMAMHNSGDLSSAASVVFTELKKLGITAIRCGVGLFSKESPRSQLYTATISKDSDTLNLIGWIEMVGHPVLEKIYSGWLNQEDYFPVLNGKELKAFYKKISPGMNMSSIPGAGSDEKQYGHFLYFTEGALNTWAERPYSEPELKILDRFKSIISLTFRRYLDLKKAEAQAREAQIEAALERVRSKTMAMHSSSDVADTAAVMFDELVKLGVEKAVRCGIGILTRDSSQIEVWTARAGENEKPELIIGHFDTNIHPLLKGLYNAWHEHEDSISYVLAGDDRIKYYESVNNQPGYPIKYDISKLPSPQYNSDFFFAEGVLYAFTSQPLNDEISSVFKRFAGVFGQTYRRYLDLQKAEAQAREAQIEAALERVRSKTMAMHNSADVGETVTLMFNELLKLGVEKIARCGIAIPDNNKMMELWTARLNQGEKEVITIGHIDMTIHPMLGSVYDAWKSKQATFEYILEGDDMTDYITAINNSSGYPVKYDTGALGAIQYHNDFFFHEGMVFAFTFQPLSAEIANIFKRFAGVFGQTYRRYLDLQRAEAQAREARIEASLERVRSKTMAMHNSADVAETVGVMFDELVKLGIEKIIRCGIGIMSHEHRTMELWTAKLGENEKINLLIGHLDMTIHKMLGAIYDAWKNKQLNFVYELAGDELVSYAKAINSYPDYPIKYDLNSLPPAQIFNDFFFNEGVVFAFTSESLNDEIVAIFKRFAGVFGQTYRRYLDLQKAENQAREAQIEAALERVRSKAMAMRSSSDLNATANTVFVELRKLGVDLVRCGLGLMEKETHISTIHAATNSDEGGSLEVLGNIDMNIHPVFAGIYSHWRKNEDYFPVLEGESLKAYYDKLHESGISVPEWKSSEKQYGYFLQFTYGSLYAWSGKQESEITIKTLKRFTSVIGLTYTRYIELQKAESNTKEAVKQASLDRVRAEIASMRKRNDLERITPLIWDELTILGIPFIRCGVFIMDEEQELIHTFLSTPDGKAIGAFHIPFDTSGNFEKMVNSWRHNVPYIDHWKEEAFSQFADTLVKQGAISSKAQYMRTLPHEGVHLNFLPFLQGMLYVGNVVPLAEDNIDLVQAVAEAFSTAYARYEDFNKLEVAKQQVDNTLTQLKATQSKLIQSEKMASLGELTAGIAHEIQNPLNFVNNFSEVNQEMLEELKAESKKPKAERDEQLETDLLNDLIENEQKINHHGKRADAIVKGMLQHSRTGGGEKQPTNINALADEFMRLSYHGLRAKDKVFNAELVTHFEPDLPKISVIGQDIGRVLLNLFNNAFYAVNQKKKALDGDYKPEVSVTTLAENGQVIIKVKDNGVGMPEHIKEKIMQPFFTTKPTGEGTGLGLSLTYDMVVKGHGGTIQVNSTEGEGSEFIIQLPIG